MDTPYTPYILLVGLDDLPQIREAMPDSVQLLEAANGHEAIFLFSKHDPALVVTGTELPLMSGIEVTSAIRSIAPRAQVAMAAQRFDDATYRLAAEAGASHFIELDRLQGQANTYLRNLLTRVRTHRELKAGQVILGHILKGMPHAALLVDWDNLTILSSNNAAQDLGYASGDACTGFLFPPGWRESAVGCLTSGSGLCHSEIIFDHGIWKTTSVMTSSKTIFFMAEDITDATLAQERIRQSENLLSAIFENSLDAILLFDSSSNVFKANQQTESLFGHSLSTVTDKAYIDFIQVPSPLEEENSQRFSAALKGVPQLFEAKALNADGHTFDAEIFLRGLTLDGRPMVLANFRDVTERRRAEVDFISIQRQLGEHLMERKAALTDLSERLRLELSKCDMLQDKMGVAQKSYEQVIATARNDTPTVQSFHLAFGDLSSRELQVVMQLAQGISVTTVAENMRISPKTVSTYKGRAMKKLNLCSESELILYALRSGLIS